MPLGTAAAAAVSVEWDECRWVRGGDGGGRVSRALSRLLPDGAAAAAGPVEWDEAATAVAVSVGLSLAYCPTGQRRSVRRLRI